MRGVAGPSKSFRFLAGFDFLKGLLLANAIIDAPLASILVLVAAWVPAYGLFRGQPWGRKSAIVLHTLIPVTAVCGYAVILFFAVPEFGRPQGHMEFVTPEAATIVVTVALAVFLGFSLIPICILMRKGAKPSRQPGAGT